MSAGTTPPNEVARTGPWPPARARLATTREALEAVYRLRYDIYTRELGKGFLSTEDHERGWIKDPEDEQDDVYIFYTGALDAMTGTLRVQVWEPGRVPDEVFGRFSLRVFTGIERYRVSEAARLVIRRGARGGEVLSSLACAAFDHVASRHDVFVCFLYCAPGLIHAYARLGFRPYPGFVIPNEDGIRLPMFMVASDLTHLQDVGSPLAPLMARHFGGERTPPDMTPFVQATRDLTPHYVTNPQRVWEEVCNWLHPSPSACSQLLEGLTSGEVETLCRCALIMEVPANKVVMRQGLVERDLYLVLAGRFEVWIDEHRLAELSRGDVLGEVSFFQEPGERVATVRSVTRGRVMVLDRHFLDRLIPTHPQLVYRLLFNLGRIVTGRLAMALQASTGKR